MKVTLLTLKLAEQVLEEKAKEIKKSKAYYVKTAKYLYELKPGEMVRIKPEGVVKGQGVEERQCHTEPRAPTM